MGGISCPVRKLAIRADRIIDRGKARENDKWWFELEDVDGVLAIPK
ncbi:hypothetical protein ACFLXD_05870 [Chloroflexota bacterium]